jgi:hypothetical protein
VDAQSFASGQHILKTLNQWRRRVDADLKALDRRVAAIRRRWRKPMLEWTLYLAILFNIETLRRDPRAARRLVARCFPRGAVFYHARWARVADAFAAYAGDRSNRAA